MSSQIYKDKRIVSDLNNDIEPHISSDAGNLNSIAYPDSTSNLAKHLKNNLERNAMAFRADQGKIRPPIML